MIRAKVRSTAQRRGDDGRSAPVGGLAHDVQGRRDDRGCPVEQLAGEGAVGEDEPHAGAQVGVEQNRLGPVAVLHPAGEHDYPEHQPEGVGDDEPLAAVDLLPGVVAAGVLPDGVGAPFTD